MSVYGVYGRGGGGDAAGTALTTGKFRQDEYQFHAYPIAPSNQGCSCASLISNGLWLVQKVCPLQPVPYPRRH